VLETYVNIPVALRNNLPEFQAVSISIPDDASTIRMSPARLAELLTTSDPIAASRSIGDGWIARRDSLVLQVPSVLVREEDNLLVNPEHPSSRDVRIVSTRTFHFDLRLAVAPA